MASGENKTITAVKGIRLGHAMHETGKTGCTVLLGPFRAAVDVRGLATGTREIDTLSPTHLVPQIDAIMLTGGSAFGLAAAEGVVKWIAEHGGGFDTGVARVPIVPAAVLFDLDAQRSTPDAQTGYQSCEAATEAPVTEGRVGAGTGATIGKMRGAAFADPGGVGSFAMRVGEYIFGAIAVVNAVGDVLDFDGQIIAGARDDNGKHVDTMRALTQSQAVQAPLTNTTLAVVATDAPLSRTALQLLARAASSAIVRRIAPSNTVFDGDVVFAISTATEVREFSPADILTFSATAQLTLEHAILRAARG